MRLLICLTTSVLLHGIFFGLSPAQIRVPNLAISLDQRSLDLQIRTRVKRAELLPPPPEEKLPQLTQPLKPKPPEQKKSVKRIVKKKEKPKRKTEPPAPTQETPPQTYVSDTQKKPRLIERAEYLSNPPPEYPERSRRRGQEGTVTLLVEINAQGLVERLQVEKSSGYSALDRAAEKAVTKWRFTPATVGGRKVPSRVLVPIRYRLNG